MVKWTYQLPGPGGEKATAPLPRIGSRSINGFSKLPGVDEECEATTSAEVTVQPSRAKARLSPDATSNAELSDLRGSHQLLVAQLAARERSGIVSVIGQPVSARRTGVPFSRIQRTGTPCSSTVGEGSDGAGLPSVAGCSQVQVNVPDRRGAVDGLPELSVRSVKAIEPLDPSTAAWEV